MYWDGTPPQRPLPGERQAEAGSTLAGHTQLEEAGGQGEAASLEFKVVC